MTLGAFREIAEYALTMVKEFDLPQNHIIASFSLNGGDFIWTATVRDFVEWLDTDDEHTKHHLGSFNRVFCLYHFLDGKGLMFISIEDIKNIYVSYDLSQEKLCKKKNLMPLWGPRAPQSSTTK